MALRSDGGLISVITTGDQSQVVLKSGEPGDAETFQWTENPYGDLILMSLVTHRHLRLAPDKGAINADHPGPLPNRKDGACFTWQAVAESAQLVPSAANPAITASVRVSAE